MSEALALPTNSAPVPANSAMVNFLMSSSSFVQSLPSASSLAAPFRSPRTYGSDVPALATTSSARSDLEGGTALPRQSYFPRPLKPNGGMEHEGTFVNH